MNCPVAIRCRNVVARAVPWVLLMALAGCGSLLQTDRPADNRYWLEPLGPSPGQDQALSHRELVLELEVVPGLDSERVLMLDNAARLKQLGTARWADRLGEVLRSVMSRSLAAQGANIASPFRGKQAERCALRLEIQEFFATGSQQPDAVRVTLSGLLSCDGGKWPLSARSARSAGAGAEAVIATLQQALNEVTRDLVSQLADAKPTTDE